MQAVILAAGLGTRMKELTKDVPKPLLRSGSETLLEQKLKNLPDAIGEVVIVVGYLGNRIREALGDSQFGRKITYVVQNELKGTGHALSLCEPVLTDRFLVLMGDDLYRKEDLTELLKHPLAVLAWNLPDDTNGRLWAELIRGEKGELLGILEKRPGRPGMLINTGAYALDRRFFDHPLEPAGNDTAEFGLPQTIVRMAKKGEEIKIVPASWWKNVTEPGDL